MIPKLIPVLLLILTFGESISSAEPFLGHFPIQSVVAGETFKLDLYRFYEPDEGTTLKAAEGPWKFEAVDAANELRLRVNSDQTGLMDIPIEVVRRDGRAVSKGVLTAAVIRRQRHTFTFKPEAKPGKAVVAGGFNGWSQDKTPLTDPDGDGVYTAEILADPGTYAYKFVVDGNWISDPSNPNKTPDGFGGNNSMLTVEGASGGRPPEIFLDRIESGDAILQIVPGSSPVEKVSVVIQNPDGTSATGKFTLAGQTIAIPKKSIPKKSWVRAAVSDAQGRVSNAVRFQADAGGGAFNWQDALMYFVFTDRFHNGDKSNDAPVKNPELLAPGNFHGGDIAGIRKKIDEGYFESLGVNVLWISPVNENPPEAYREFTPPYRLYTGYHGYWPVSSDRVDPHFGRREELKSLVGAAHKRGMKVLVDLIVNHVHDSHPLYQEHPDWFTPRILPDGKENLRLWDAHPFTTWFDRFLPDIDHFNPRAARAVLENSEWWAKEFDLDGFRLDAVKHVPPAFWRQFRGHLRGTIEKNSGRQLYLVGETFMSREGIMSFVGPNMLDGQFDFPLYDTLRSVFAQNGAGFQELESSLSASERIYGKESLMSTLVGNHDKSRFMAYADGDLPDPKEADEEEVGWLRPPKVDKDESYEKLKQAMAFILAIDGVPMIYYGDEIGLTGAGDPDNRRDMRFGADLSAGEKSTLEHVSTLNKIRRSHPALRYGHRRAVLAESNRYAFVRAFSEDRVLVAFNRSGNATEMRLSVSPELPDGNYVDEITGTDAVVRDGKITLSIDARSAAIVARADGKTKRPVRKSETPKHVPPAAGSYKTVGMAGTINGWNANDREYQLKPAGASAWELVRFFQKGNYLFKFVMNGGWDVHRGMKSGAALEQPGKDIPLEVPASGYFKVSLNLAEERWSFAPVPAPKATARVEIQNPYSLGREITLDASPSLAREGKRILSYVWSQPGDASPKLAGLPITAEQPAISIRPDKAGLYHLVLSVNDGEEGIDQKIELDVRASFQVTGIPGEDPAPMERNADGTFRLLAPARAGEMIAMNLIENYDASKILGVHVKYSETLERTARFKMLRGAAPVRLMANRPGVFEMIYDPATSELVIRRSSVTRFFFDPARGAPDAANLREVSVAGTFNNWSMTQHPMTRRADGTYELYADLPQGLHHYKFVVNGKNWIADPNSPRELSTPDGHNGLNSGVLVGERGADFGEAKPNQVLFNAVKHDPNEIDDFNPFSKSQVDLRIRVREKDVQSAVLIQRQGGAPVKRIPLEKLNSKFGFDYFGGYIPVPAGASTMEYIFELTDGSDIVYYTPSGQKIGSRQVDQSTPWFSRDVRVGFPTPDWAKHVVWYQIMPERWRNGDPSNDPDGSLPWTWDWFKPYSDGEKQKFYGGGGVWHRMFGGDIKGVMQSLDYLEDLGVTGIYFNPVFEASSHHKYNAQDYKHIDDNFGVKGDVAQAQLTETADPATWRWTPTDRMFLEFLSEAHKRGFKVIIDGVFNHSGTDFWAFRDLVKNKKNSPYKDWYVVRQWDVTPANPGDAPFLYDGWAGFSSLPEFAEDDKGLLPGIRKHIFDITRRWMDPNRDGNPSDGIDGWRLDVPENVHEKFWVDWRKVVKGENPDAYITGEIWENAAHRLRGEHYDAVMNYEFTKRVYGFFLPGGKTPEISATAFSRAFEELQSSYLPQVNFVLQNLLSSHDVDRIASAIHNRAGWKQGRVQDDNPDYKTDAPGAASYDVLKRIVVFQMTWIGAPMIYYGDEVGLYGADDPTNRMPMWWNDLMPYDNPAYQIRQDLADHHKRMIAIRNTYPALRTGRAEFIYTDDASKTVVFERKDHANRLIVAVSAADAGQTVSIPLSGGTYVDLADPANTVSEKKSVEGIGSNRTRIRVRDTAPRLRPTNGRLTLDLKKRPWAILVEMSK